MTDELLWELSETDIDDALEDVHRRADTCDDERFGAGIIEGAEHLHRLLFERASITND